MEKEKVLCIEDNPADARLIRELLADDPSHLYEITFANKLANISLLTNENKFDVILLDLSLPDSSGMDTLHSVKLLMPDTPIIILTGSEEKWLDKEIIQNGAQDFIRKKSISSEILLHSLRYAKDRHIYVKKVQESENRFKSVIDNALDSIIVVSDQGVIEYTNPACELLFSCTSGTLVGQLFGIPVNSKDFSEISIPGKSGKIKTGEMRSSEIMWDDRSCFLVTIRDVSIRKENEEKEQNYLNQLKLVNQEKDVFFSVIAHDLRGPFSSFLGLTQLLASESCTISRDDLIKSSQTMHKSAQNINNLLENLLQWAQFKQNKTSFLPETFDLLPEIENVYELVRNLAEQKKISIKLNLADGLKCFSDKFMFKTILRNLVFNAIKFNHTGGAVTIKVSPKENGYIELSVSDTGIGMPEKILCNLFNMNVNTKRTGTAGELSTGLGLFLCKDFVEKCGGALSVESKEGYGSTFTFTVPVGHSCY